jgi:hypothetical protein
MLVSGVPKCAVDFQQELRTCDGFTLRGDMRSQNLSDVLFRSSARLKLSTVNA